MNAIDLLILIMLIMIMCAHMYDIDATPDIYNENQNTQFENISNKLCFCVHKSFKNINIRIVVLVSDRNRND